MPFEGRTLRDASQLFREHLNRLLSHTITHVPIIVSIDPRTNRIVISFRQGGVLNLAMSDSILKPVGVVAMKMRHPTWSFTLIHLSYQM